MPSERISNSIRPTKEKYIGLIPFCCLKSLFKTQKTFWVNKTYEPFIFFHNLIAPRAQSQEKHGSQLKILSAQYAMFMFNLSALLSVWTLRN